MLIMTLKRVPLEGDSEEAMVNRHLFTLREDWSGPRRIAEGVFLRHGPPMDYHGRAMVPGIIDDGEVEWYQPFYQSTGECTPTLSPTGTFWPCSGVFSEGWIGKHYLSTEAELRWLLHEKEVVNLSVNLQTMCRMLEEIHKADHGRCVSCQRAWQLGEVEGI